MTKVLAICHVHSDWSYDGTWSLEKLANMFGRLGIRVLLTSEHEHGFDEARWASYRSACEKASTDRLKIIPGLEYNDKTNSVHILVWGNIPFLGAEQETDNLLRRVTDFGGVAVFAHPSCKQAWKKFDRSWTKHLFGVEVWNRKFDGFVPSQKGLEILSSYDGMLPFVGIDFHCKRQFFPLLMAMELDGGITEQAVLESFFERQCYPLVCGLPLSHVTDGVGAIAVEWMERVRKNLLRMARAVSGKTGLF